MHGSSLTFMYYEFNARLENLRVKQAKTSNSYSITVLWFAEPVVFPLDACRRCDYVMFCFD